MTGLRAVLDDQLFDIACKLLLEQTGADWVAQLLVNEAASAQMMSSELCYGVDIQKLHVLLSEKLSEEQRRHTYLASTASREREDVFNETDRIVANLLDIHTDEGQHAGDVDVECLHILVFMQHVVTSPTSIPAITRKHCVQLSCAHVHGTESQRCVPMRSPAASAAESHTMCLLMLTKHSEKTLSFAAKYHYLSCIKLQACFRMHAPRQLATWLCCESQLQHLVTSSPGC